MIMSEIVRAARKLNLQPGKSTSQSFVSAYQSVSNAFLYITGCPATKDPCLCQKVEFATQTHVLVSPGHCVLEYFDQLHRLNIGNDALPTARLRSRLHA